MEKYTTLPVSCPSVSDRYYPYYLTIWMFPLCCSVLWSYNLSDYDCCNFYYLTACKVGGSGRTKNFLRLWSKSCIFKILMGPIIMWSIIMSLITLCMKLSWFCHTNSGQLFCNCPLFVIALVPGLFFGGKPDETCCHSVVASKWLNFRESVSLIYRTKYYNLNTNRDY